MPRISGLWTRIATATPAKISPAPISAIWFKAGEILALRLASIHNLRFLTRMMEEMRAAIEQDCLRDWAEAFYARHGRDNW